MAKQRILPHGQAFTTLHGVLVAGSDPSLGAVGAPVKHIQTVTSQTMKPDGDRPAIALLAGGPPSPQTASFDVNDNDFSDRAVIILGDYEIVSQIDYLVAGTATLTAVAIAAAIDNLPEYNATSALTVVNITREPPLERVEFRVIHHGAVTNFDTLVPATGFMNPGAPLISAPTLT
jgi:hypothetical protein